MHRGTKAVCTFLGHQNVYDPDIYQRLWKAVCSVVEQEAETEFLFYREGNFYDLCFAAVQEARSRFPQKKISVFWAVPMEQREMAIQQFRQHTAHFPACALDGVISPPYSIPAPAKSQDITIPRKKMGRWVILRSTHLICGVYSNLFSEENQMLTFAQRTTIHILDVTSAETAAALQAGVGQLSEREQAIIASTTAGQSYKVIGEAFGISKTAISTILHRAGHRLGRMLKYRFSWLQQQNPPEPARCCILGLGAATHETLCAFERAVDFLNKCHDVVQFDIAADLCDSEYLYILQECRKPHKRTHITAVLHGQETENQEAEASRFMPPCHAVRYLGDHGVDPLAWVDAMLERSRFCICDLSQEPFAGRIRAIAQRDGTIVLDMGKRWNDGETEYG
ncbi:MAG: sigma-70 family RNA polymerase sigma factor [Oscillospiraceae bacterium]|nr:sigma-70 family RNA polymerase sigma factor [Oscillospiraceae bacterium]